MFSNLKQTILKLNGDVASVANQEKAKSLRKNLIIWACVCLVVGIIGVIGCFVAFSLLGFNTIKNFSIANSFDAMFLIPFFLVIPFAIIAIIGSKLLKLGLSILIAGVTTDFVDKSLNKRCECGNMISENEKFCPKCGRAIKKVCPQCNTNNENDNEFCSNCGYKF